MRSGCLSVIALILVAGPAPAQFWVGRGGVIGGGELRFNYSGRNVGISAAVGRFGFASFGYSSIPYTGFYGYSYTGPWFPPPVFISVVPQPLIVQPIVINVGAVEPKMADPERFLVIRPDRPDPNPPAILPKKQKDVELAVEPAPFPVASVAAGNPRVEADRQVLAGREAFSSKDFGRARDCLRRAATLRPDDAFTLFLLAQVEMALGKYDDATGNILAGLKLRPDWPSTAYRPREVYGRNLFQFDDHLQSLRDALDASPRDVRLLFLMAVQLWFDGRREEGRTLFVKTREMTADPGPIDLFLRIKPM